MLCLCLKVYRLREGMVINMEERFVQEKITPNHDSYNPRQVTCFQKPWAILFKSLNEDYFDLYLFVAVFYENFMYKNYFYWEDFNKNMNENFYKFSKEILEPRFDVKIDKLIYKDKEEFISKIEQSLFNGDRVLVPADMIELPYYEDYKVDNHIHNFIIRGYDRKKEVFYILDNMHIDNGSDGLYKNFVLTYNRMFKMAKRCFESFFPNEENPFFWKLSSREDNNTYTAWEALKNHKEELKLINEQDNMINLPEYKILEEGSDNINNFSRSYAKILNYKQVYYDILFKILRKIKVSENEVNELEQLKEELYKEWETLRMYILYYSSKKDKMLSKLKNEFEKCVSNEKKFRECFISIIDNNKEKGEVNVQGQKKEKYVLYEHNLNEAVIEREKNNVWVYHDKKHIYDTWKVQDNAAQLNFMIDSKDKIEFKFDLVLHNAMDFPFFGGLIVKNQSGERYLFGNDAKGSIALYCPQLEENFTLQKQPYFKDSMSLKINIENEGITFYYKEVEDADWITFYDMKIIDIQEIGIISKTWNAIEHKSDFSNIEVLINNEESEIYYC